MMSKNESDEDPGAEQTAAREGSILSHLRSRWVLVAAALFLLAFVIFVGPARP